jgi:iron complex transport system substrate-binding protein
VLLVAATLAACAPPPAQEASVGEGCGDATTKESRPTERVEITHAENFRVDYGEGFKRVEVSNPWRGSDAAFVYHLVPCGADPELPPDAVVITIPPRRVATSSTTQLPHLVALDLLDHLAGHNRFDFVYEPEIRRRVSEHGLVEIGDGVRLNPEVLVELAPDIVFTSSIGDPELDVLGRLDRAGIAAVIDAAWMEATPLGRAEWIKFTSLFFDREAEANRIFADIEARYEELSSLAVQAAERPSVLVGTPFQGTWHVSGGDAYQARLIEDAAGRYLWRDDDSRGAIPLDFETVYATGLDADIWLHPYGWKSLADGLRSDERMGDFEAFRAGRVYNNDHRTTEGGGNDYWESGSLYADRVLADLIHLFHPDLLTGYELVYHRALPPG